MRDYELVPSCVREYPRVFDDRTMDRGQLNNVHPACGKSTQYVDTVAKKIRRFKLYKEN